MRVVAVMILATTAVSAQVPARVADVYRGVVAVYVAGGEMKQVVMPLQGWTRKEFESAIDAIIARRDSREIEAAAVLQLEFGVAVVDASAASAEQHFILGKKLVDTLRKMTLSPREGKSRPLPPAVVEFSTNWLAVAGSTFLSINDPTRAYPWITSGLRLAPRSAVLTTLWGLREELVADTINPHLTADGGIRTRTSLDVRRRLLLVADTYRKAIDYDPNYTAAHLRLARVLLGVGDLDDAQKAAERAQALAQEPAYAYQAALTLGAIHEQRQNLAAARRAYERALEIVPVSQTVTVALGYLDVLAGRPDLAQARAKTFMQAPKDDVYWWEYKTGSVYHPGLETLRKRVRR